MNLVSTINVSAGNNVYEFVEPNVLDTTLKNYLSDHRRRTGLCLRCGYNTLRELNVLVCQNRSCGNKYDISQYMGER